MYVLGSGESDLDGETDSDDATGPGDVSDRDCDRPPHTARIGYFLARDGSAGATVGVDLDRPHAGVVFGKRGTGKSYTL
ncbi:MAG: ATPase, partial [Halorubrum sp.]